jgi:hypothetical protein
MHSEFFAHFPGLARASLNRHWIVLLSALFVGLVVFIAYFPSLNVGFWMDDFIALDIAGRISGWDYLVKFFDPRVQRLWYRPMVGMQWGLEYLIFRAEPFFYHVVQVSYHLLNSLLVMVLTARVTRRQSVGLIAALLYATFPLSSMSIYWTSVHDPLAIVFYLSSIWFWMDYCESGQRNRFVLAFLAFLVALLTKEVSATLPGLLFLADRFLVAKPVRIPDLVKQYFLFSIPLGMYAWFEWIVTTRSEFTQQIGYRLGESTVYVFLKFLSLLAFPWELGEPLNFIWLAGAALLFLMALFRDRRMLFLAAIAVFPTLIVSPIPPHLFNPRYLYFPLITSAVGYALVLVFLADGVRRASLARIVRLLIGGLVIGVIAFGSSRIAEQTENFGGFIRQIRLQFRPIYQAYSTFPPGTFLYFLDLPLQTLDISGVMFLRYGANVTVGGIDRGTLAGLREHNTAYVWYQDGQGKFTDQVIERESRAQTSTPLPARFGNAIVLDSLEVTNSRVKQGDAVIVLVRWQAIAPIDKNYTVFVHLVDEKGNVVSGYDGQPRKGYAPTTSWQKNSFLIDSVIVPINFQVLPGTYQLEIGWYDSQTMERLPLADAAGDQIIVGPVDIE